MTGPSNFSVFLAVVAVEEEVGWDQAEGASGGDRDGTGGGEEEEDGGGGGVDERHDMR
jgi:hypothetical protein